MVQIKPPPIYDTSHWKVIPDFALVDPRPKLVLTKATEGTSYVDPTFIKYFQDLLQDGIGRGCFHFFRKAQDSLAQAKHFCNTIRPPITDKDILVLDVEEGGETAAQLKTWLEHVRSQFPRNLILIYSRKNILEAIPTFVRQGLNVRWLAEKVAPYLPAPVLKTLDYTFAMVERRNNVLNAIQMTMAERAFFKEFPTWPAGYPLNPDLYSTIPSFYIPDQARWGEPWLWQYTDRAFVKGISNEVDCNLGLPPLLKWLGSEPTPEPLPDNGETMELYGEAIGNITMRTGPGVGFTVATINGTSQYVVNGDKIWATEEQNGFWKISKIIRNGAEVTLPAVAWCGTAYINKQATPPPTPPPPEDSTVTVDVIMHDVKVAGDRYAARGIVANKEA